MKNQIKTIVLLGSLSALVIGVGSAFAPGHIYLFGALALAMNLGAYFFSDRIVLAMHRAREVQPHEAPELHGMVAELSGRAGIPKPRLFVIHEDQPNAFATGRNPKHGVVAVTDGIVRLLTPRELRAVLAHEIAHIKNRDILISSVAAAVASLLSSLANMAIFSSLFGGGRDEEGESGSNILLVLVAPFAASLIQLGISRSREYLADETGAALCADPLALASALRKLEQGAELIPQHAAQPATASLFIMNPLSGAGSSLMSLFSTHPRVEERVRRLEQLAAKLGGQGSRTTRTAQAAA